MDEQTLPPFFFEIFDRSLPRHGPGNEASTVRALTLLGLLDTSGQPLRSGGAEEPLRVLDVGCGTGMQTIALAKRLEVNITALDFHSPFLEELRGRAEEAGVASKIETRLGDMRELPTWQERFDAVWAEGSLFVMGFAEALEACRQVLRPGGALAASELTWLRTDAPKECRDFFAQEYPAMTDVATNLAAAEKAGYDLVAHFTLPDEAWWIPFYRPLGDRVAELRSLYPGDAEKAGMLDWVQLEIEMFRKYSRYYGYVFYLLRRS